MQRKSINPNHIFMAVIVLSALAGNNLNGVFGQFTAVRQEASRQSDAAIQDQLRLQELETTQETKERESTIAERRYRNGCVPIVSSANPSTYVTITLNQVVLDGATGLPLSPGPIVCDAQGTTAVMVDDDADPTTPAVAQKLAFTGNRALVSEVLAQHQGATYFLPNQ